MHKYPGPFEILEAVGKQACKLKLPANCRINRIYPEFYVSLLKGGVTRMETIDQKIADQLEFEERKQPKRKVDLIMDSMVFAQEAFDSRPPRLYYLIQRKGERNTEDT